MNRRKFKYSTFTYITIFYTQWNFLNVILSYSYHRSLHIIPAVGQYTTTYKLITIYYFIKYNIIIIHCMYLMPCQKIVEHTFLFLEIEYYTPSPIRIVFCVQ